MIPVRIVLLCQNGLAHLAGTRFLPDLHPLGSGAPVQCEGRTGSHLQSHSNPFNIRAAKWGPRLQSGFRACFSGKTICNPVRRGRKILRLCPKLFVLVHSKTGLQRQTSSGPDCTADFARVFQQKNNCNPVRRDRKTWQLWPKVG